MPGPDMIDAGGDGLVAIDEGAVAIEDNGPRLRIGLTVAFLQIMLPGNAWVAINALHSECEPIRANQDCPRTALPRRSFPPAVHASEMPPPSKPRRRLRQGCGSPGATTGSPRAGLHRRPGPYRARAAA